MKYCRKLYSKALKQDCDLYHFHDPELLGAGLKLKKTGKKVDCRGMFPFAQIQQIIHQSAIGTSILRNVLQYNHIDTLATKVYEYMYHGIPVIMNDAPYNVKLNERLKFGICVNPESPEEIAAAINYLLSHPKETAEMGRNGRRAVRQEFNWYI